MKTKQRIIELLRITDEEYAIAVEAFAYAFIAHYCYNSKGAEGYLTQTASFWVWWKRHFDLRDEIFLSDYGTYTDAALAITLRDFWNDSHQPEIIEGRIPDSAWQQMLNMIGEEEDAQRPGYAHKNHTL